MEEQFAETANLLAEPTRARMLLRLLNGKALPAGELAAAGNVSPQTASGHLSRLLRAKLLRVESQGRHRYYRLAGPEVADALEAILVLLPDAQRRFQQAPPDLGTLAHARTCYSHVAGWLGVRIADALQSKEYIVATKKKRFLITQQGRAWLTTLGIDSSSSEARQCLDWTERRAHLAGPLAIALYRRVMELNWLAPLADTRALRVTLRGKKEFWTQLQIAIR